MSITKAKKTEVIKANKVSANDTGSSQVQIAILTERINTLTEHFKTHKKDDGGKRGMIRLINTRKKLLAYLAKTDVAAYEATLKKHGLRK